MNSLNFKDKSFSKKPKHLKQEEDRNYRLIFMDLNMPGMNGLETTEKIRKMNTLGEIDLSTTKIVLYSCLSNTADLPMLRLHFDEVACKPIDIDNLRIIL